MNPTFPNFTPEEIKSQCKPQLPWFADTHYYKELIDGTWGSFAQSLATCWYHADPSNRRRLVNAFPDTFNIDKFRCY